MTQEPEQTRRRFLTSTFCAFVSASVAKANAIGIDEMDAQTVVNALAVDMREKFPDIDNHTIDRIAEDFESINKTIAAGPYISGISTIIGYEMACNSNISDKLSTRGGLGIMTALGFSLLSGRGLSEFPSQEKLQEYLSHTYLVPTDQLENLTDYLTHYIETKIRLYGVVPGVMAAGTGPIIEDLVKDYG